MGECLIVLWFAQWPCLCLSLDKIRKWSCLYQGHEVTLSDSDVLGNCLRSKEEHQGLAVSEVEHHCGKTQREEVFAHG